VIVALANLEDLSRSRHPDDRLQTAFRALGNPARPVTRRKRRSSEPGERGLPAVRGYVARAGVWIVRRCESRTAASRDTGRGCGWWISATSRSGQSWGVAGLRDPLVEYGATVFCRCWIEEPAARLGVGAEPGPGVCIRLRAVRPAVPADAIAAADENVQGQPALRARLPVLLLGHRVRYDTGRERRVRYHPRANCA
jgi:hypothetical protein